MKDRTLFIISFTVLIVGMIALSFISLGREEPEIMIKNLDQVGFDNVKVSGRVSDIIIRGDITYLTIEQPTELEGVAFDSVEGIQTGDTIIATGELQDFKGKKSLILDSIKKVD